MAGAAGARRLLTEAMQAASVLLGSSKRNLTKAELDELSALIEAPRKRSG